MKLDEFIERFIARNTLIRLWKPLEKGCPYRDKEMLGKTIMEWQAQEIEILKDVEVIHITDIICERNLEAVNIVLDTELTHEEVMKAIEEYKRCEARKRMFCIEKEVK